jgi:predicted nucleic acid-binding protein
MSDHDLWIAATALAQDPPLPLLTNDAGYKNVAEVSDLVVVQPE